MRARLTAVTLTLLALLALAPAESSAQRRGVQTLFGSETPIRRPVRLPRDVIGQILAADPDRGCRAAETEAAETLSGSRVDINGDGAADLIAQGTGGCFIGAHATHFFVFSKSETRLAPGFDLLLTTLADYLEVKRTQTNGFRDIETGYHTAVEMYATVWKFDGQKYQPRECTVETFRTRRRVRVPCER